MMRMSRLFFPVLFLTVWSGTMVMGQTHKADDILGTWLNEEATGKIQLYKENGKYFGKVIWLKEPNDVKTGKPRTDVENPDEKMRSRPLVGLVNMRDFTFDGKNEWSGGTIYDPKNGKTYKCYIQFESANKLKVRGYIGVSVIGRNTYWTRSIAPKN